MNLSLFRAPDLAFWSLAVLVLGGGLGLAAYLGGDEERAATAPGSSAVATAETSQSGVQARNIQALMPAGTAAGIDPVALDAWAQAVSLQARDGAAVRDAEGAGAEDDLRAEFLQVATYAAQLSEVAGDRVAATAVRTQIGLRSARLSALVTGMPAPALPAGSTDLFGQTGAAPNPPTAGIPQTPDVPTVPHLTKEIP